MRFWLRLQKRIDTKKIGSTTERNSLEISKNSAKEREFKFTLQWVRLKLHLLNVQYDPWKRVFTVTWKIPDTSIFTNCLTSAQPGVPEKIVRQTWFRRMTKILTFSPFCTASYYGKLENPSSRLETRVASRSLTYPARKIISHSFRKKFLKLLLSLPEIFQHTQ